MSRHTLLLLACAIGVPAAANAAVVELDGDALVGAYVQGISIGQVVTDKPFDSDDQEQRDAVANTQNAQGATSPEVAVKNVEALGGPVPRLDDLIPPTLATIADDDTRDLAVEALTADTKIIHQTILGEHLDVNFDRLADFGIQTPTTRDVSALRQEILQLMPSSTGYQFELMK